MWSDNIAKSPSLKRAWHEPTSLAYRVRTAGRVRRERYHSTLGTYHHDAMLMLFLDGSGTYRYEEHSIPVCDGMIGLVLPDEPVGLLMADSENPYDHFYIRFDGAEALLQAQRVREKYSRDAAFFAFPTWEEYAELFQRVQSLVQRFGNPEANVEDELPKPADGALLELLARLTSEPARGRPVMDRRTLETYLVDHVAKPIDLAAMADHFGVSKPHLCRVGKERLERTVGDLWREIKIEWAQTLLSERSLSIAQVARRVGFDDPFYFSRVFRKSTGQSPQQWRKNRP